MARPTGRSSEASSSTARVRCVPVPLVPAPVVTAVDRRRRDGGVAGTVSRRPLGPSAHVRRGGSYPRIRDDCPVTDRVGRAQPAPRRPRPARRPAARRPQPTLLGARRRRSRRLGGGRPHHHERAGAVRRGRRVVAVVREARLDVRDEVGVPGTGPVAFASFTFTDDSPGSVLVVPRVLVGRRDGISWITEFADGDGRSAVQAVTPVRPTGTLRFADGRLPVGRYRLAVAEAVRRMQAGELDKAALAHDLLAIGDAPLDPRFLLGGLVDAATRRAGRTPSTGSSAPPPSCWCGARTAPCRHGCWPARSGPARATTCPASCSARRRTATSTRWPSTRWPPRCARCAPSSTCRRRLR